MAQRKPKKLEVAIIVAIIGLVGTLLAALLHNWREIFHREGRVTVDATISEPVSEAYTMSRTSEGYTVSYEAAKLPYESWPVEHPVLDIKVTNNSPETILVSKAILEVERSTQNSRPLVRIQNECGTGKDGVIFVRNYGWGPVTNAVVRFNLESGDGFPERHASGGSGNRLDLRPAQYTFQRSLKTFEDVSSFDVWHELEISGVDLRCNRIQPS